MLVGEVNTNPSFLSNKKGLTSKVPKTSPQVKFWHKKKEGKEVQPTKS
jgi:hypothetical protein